MFLSGVRLILMSFYCSLPTFATEFQARITDQSLRQYVYIFIYMLNGLTQAQDTNSAAADFLMFSTHLRLVKALLIIFLKEEVAVSPVVTNWLVAAAAACGLQGM